MDAAAPAMGATVPRPPRYAGLRAAAPALIAGVIGLGLLFWRECRAAVEVWDASTAYNHCFLVLPIALWMAWERRDSFARTPMRPVPWLAMGALPLAAGWFVADRIGIMEGRQLAAMGLLQLLFLSVLGWELWRKLSAPLLYLIFLVPFGAFLVPVLQDITAVFVVQGLNMLGILHYTDGYIIELPAGTFFIAEACAGLRFLIASIAFGTLYACTIYRTPVRRAVFIGVSIVVPIIANGFRALGIVVAGHYLGSAEAAAADHVIYGWGFFSFVTLLLILIGLPFRQDREDAPGGHERRREPAQAPVAPGGMRLAYGAVAGVLVLGLAGPGASGLLDHAGTPPPLSTALDLGGDCRPATAPGRAAPVAASQAWLECAGGDILVSVAVFSPRTNPGQVVLAQRHLSGEVGSGDGDVHWLGTAPRWRVLETREPFGSRATALWIDGVPTALSLATRMRMARNSMLGARAAPVLVALAPRIDWAREGAAGKPRARQMMTRFIEQRPDLPERIAALAASAGR